MSNARHDVLRPSYLRDFKCIAGECPDICCRGWNITVDRWFCEKYEALPESRLKEKVRACIVPVDDARTDVEYARIKLADNGRCPLLTPEKLCLLHLDLGVGFLPQVCFMFPRLTAQVLGSYEQIGDIACPVIARLALLNPGGISFEPTPLPAAQKRLMSLCNIFGARASEVFGPSMKHFQAARIFSINVLKQRDLHVNDRLVLLGMFYRDMQDCLDLGQTDDIPGLITRRKSMLQTPDLPKLFAGLPRTVKAQVGLLLSMISRYRAYNLDGGNSIINSFEDSIKGLGYSPGATLDAIVSTFLHACHDHYEPYMRSREYILENYLVNEFFRSCLPLECAEPRAVFDEYRDFVARFALLRLFLIGIAGCRKGLTDDLLINTVGAFGRLVNNSSRFIKWSHGFLGESGLATAGHLALLANI